MGDQRESQSLRNLAASLGQAQVVTEWRKGTLPSARYYDQTTRLSRSLGSSCWSSSWFSRSKTGMKLYRSWSTSSDQDQSALEVELQSYSSHGLRSLTPLSNLSCPASLSLFLWKVWAFQATWRASYQLLLWLNRLQAIHFDQNQSMLAWGCDQGTHELLSSPCTWC